MADENNFFEEIVTFTAGLSMGLLVAWYYLQQRLGGCDEVAYSQHLVLEDETGEAEELKIRLREKTSALEELERQLSQQEETVQELRGELAERAEAVERLEGAVRERDKRILELKPCKPDKLKLIEGIGPKISTILQEAGIMTFAQLAATDVERLKEILSEAGLGALADPTTWPEQAELAAAADLDALKSLQQELKGGRRV